MLKLLRRTFSFTERQMTHLMEKAEKLQTSVSDVVRRLVDKDIDGK